MKMKKQWLLFVGLLTFVFLSACSLSTTPTGEEEDIGGIKSTEDLPEDRKVREIEMLLTTADYDPVRYELGLMVAEEWRKLGFEVVTTPLDWNRLSELGISQKDYDAFTLNWAGNAERIDPDHFVYATLHSSQAGLGSYNIVGYENADYDEVAEETRRNTDTEIRREAVYRAQEIFMEDIPYIPVVHRNQIMAYNSDTYENMTYMMGEGLNSFWTFMNATPITDQTDLRWGYPSDIATLNPLNATNTHDFQVLRLIYDRLVRITPEGEPEFWAAEDIIDVNEDGRTFDVILREGMTFHDGEPVTVDDVKFSFDLVKEVEAPYFIGMVDPIESIEVINEQTVRFELDKPFAPFISNTLGQMFIFPEHYWQPLLDEGAEVVLEHNNEKAIGSGPFELEFWRTDQDLKMNTFDNHFEQPVIDGILKVPYANVQGMVAALGQSEIDTIGWWVEPLQAEELNENESVEVIEVPDHGFYHMNVNMRRMPFDDLAVRQALSLVIPRERILTEILEGNGEPASSNIGPPNEFWHNESAEEIAYDLEKAINILSEAGFEWDEDGKIYYPEGKSDQDLEHGILRDVE